MTRLLVECTYVFEHPNDNSGIQRVVRNVIARLNDEARDIECIPVVFVNGKVYHVRSLAPLDTSAPMRALSRAHIALERLRFQHWSIHSRVKRLRPFRHSKLAERLLYIAARITDSPLAVILRLAALMHRKEPPPTRATPFEPQAGDQLLLLDSSWHADFFPVAERLKQQGVGIVSVIYDLIPLTHPQFCDAGLVRVFDHWFDWIARTADGYIAISKTIRDQVKHEVTLRLGAEITAQRWFDYFYLGSELDLVKQSPAIDKNLPRIFDSQAPVYLMVSTIEPRKNHQYLLDAFDILWHEKQEVRLCIIGKVGWKCEDLLHRIRRHPQLNKRLFMFNRLDDCGLQYAYQHSKALIFPSFVEGFGLPIVEAMQRGLPVMASDIPIFREIGGDYAAWFSLETPASLATLIKRYEHDNIFPAKSAVEYWTWISWNDATHQLISAARPSQGHYANSL